MCNTYNGYKNYETWNVALWIDNDEGSQAYWEGHALEILNDSKPGNYCSLEDKARRTLADELKDYHEENSPTAEGNSVYSDLLQAALDSVDWWEIAGNMIDTAKENGWSPEEETEVS